jgi:UDP-N-acetylglucosamine transferase subunit ALG13
MIFVTVGAQMPFDRLVGAVDAWAARRHRDDVFAQIGDGGAEPRHLRWVRRVDPDEFRRLVRECDVVVTHAGMGTILSALELGKPIVVMPRRGSLRETRNDHQVATAEMFRAQGRVQVAEDEAQMGAVLDHVETIGAADRIASRASPELLLALRDFVRTAQAKRDSDPGRAG